MLFLLNAFQYSFSYHAPRWFSKLLYFFLMLLVWLQPSQPVISDLNLPWSSSRDCTVRPEKQDRPKESQSLQYTPAACFLVWQAYRQKTLTPWHYALYYCQLYYLMMHYCWHCIIMTDYNDYDDCDYCWIWPFYFYVCKFSICKDFIKYI